MGLGLCCWQGEGRTFAYGVANYSLSSQDQVGEQESFILVIVILSGSPTTRRFGMFKNRVKNGSVKSDIKSDQRSKNDVPYAHDNS